MASPRPFEVSWNAADVGEILSRIRSYPWPPAPDVPDGWAYGCDGKFLKDLCAHWLDGYDWRAAVRNLNRYPQFIARVDDFELHFVHVTGEASGKRPLLLSPRLAGEPFRVLGRDRQARLPVAPRRIGR